MSRRSRRTAVGALIVCLSLLVVTLAAWGIDSSVHNGHVRRNVEVAGTAVGGLNTADLRERLDGLAAAHAEVPVTIETPAGSLESTLGELGVTLDVDATAEAAEAVGRDVPTVQRPLYWIGSLFSTDQVPAAYVATEGVASTVATEVAEANRVEPVEPSLTVTDGVITVVAGTDGAALPLADLSAMIVAAAEQSQGDAITLRVDPNPIAPRYSDDDAQQVAARANELTATPLVLVVGGATATIAPEVMRPWIGMTPGPTSLELTIDEAQVAEVVSSLVGDVGTPPVQLRFSIAEDGTVTYTEGVPGTTCCADDTSQRVIAALTSGASSVELGLDVVPPDHDAAWAESLQIREPIATFTTRYAAGQPRAHNIALIADLVRGAVIPPGGTFSVNDHVGQRTRAKGFLEDGVIYEGRMTRDVGGGVSQFATTLFNAAFFAGLDIPEYQMHTLYISRYPYGREATLSFPSPDLKIRNETPYGVMIWTSHTPDSVTVTLYSTPWVTGEETGQSRSSQGPCTRVTTERTRTWIEDGRTATDTFSALYQPADGVRC